VFLTLVTKMKRLVIKEVEDELAVMKAIEKYGPIWGFMAPSLVNAIVRHPEFPNYDLSSFKFILTAGSPLQTSTVDRVKVI